MDGLLGILCEWLSRRLCRVFTGHDMTLCAYSWWRKDRPLWRRSQRLLDRLFRRIERDHCRNSYERRFDA